LKRKNLGPKVKNFRGTLRPLLRSRSPRGDPQRNTIRNDKKRLEGLGKKLIGWRENHRQGVKDGGE